MNFKKKINISICAFLIIIFSLSYISVFAVEDSTKINNQTLSIDSNLDETQKIVIKDDPDVNSQAAILIDNTTNKVLYEKNGNNKMYPASMTKILTAIITIENCDLNDKVTASYDAIMSVPSGYSIAAIQVGETLTVKELLEVLLVHSANDAANVLAQHVGSSIDSFASIMNTKALEIGCKNSHFTNPSGKHSDDHYSTPYDMAIIMKYCMKNETFRQICSMKSCSIPATDKYEQRTFTTTNSLILQDSNYYYKYNIAGKTGFTTEARNCLVSVSEKDGFETICVVMGAESNGVSYRFSDSMSIYDYAYSKYAIKNIKKQNDVITTIKINNATSDTKNLDLLISEDITTLVKQSEDISSIQPEINLNEDLSAPISVNQVVGNVSFTIEGVRYTTSLIASHTVEKADYMVIIFLIGALIIVILLLILLIYNKKRKVEVLEETNCLDNSNTTDDSSDIDEN